jgi:hypothetical protein
VAELQTQPTKASVAAFLNAIEDPDRRRDCKAVAKLMEKVTKSKPKMWGPAIVGFGSYRYVNTTNKPQDWFLAGFSPRKQNLTLYIMAGFGRRPDLMKRLGKFSTGKSCLYIKRLSDIDEQVLASLIEDSNAYMKPRSV